MSSDVAMSDASEYQLSKTIPTFDSSAVKCMCYRSSSNTILLGSEGGIVTGYDCNTLTSSFLNICHPYAITSLLSKKDGFIVGSREGYIRVYKEKELDYVYTGHDNSITSLNWRNTNLVSSSWDGTAKVWNGKDEILKLSGHENATCSIVLPNGTIVTGSAGRHENNAIVDFKLRVWDINGNQKEIDHGHTSSIRCLTHNDNMFASCGNDGKVILYDCKTFHVINSFHVPSGASLLLSVSFIGEYIATTSEDGYLYIWDINTQQCQIIPHPACVWSVITSPNGDIITGCGDGKARIFTKAHDRTASSSEISDFNNEAQSFHTKTGLSQQEVDKLPAWETDQYTIKGKKEGHVQLFKKQNNKAIAAQWSDSSQSWIEVGEVTATDNNNKGGTINGQNYDYVFPIEVDTTAGTVQTLQIGYNIGDNPFVVAQKFIDEHELNQYYLSQIADYIQKRIKDDNVVQLGGNNNNGTSQPMTSSTPSFTYLPIKTYLYFDTGIESLSKITSKILQFQTKYNSNSITEEELTTLQTTLKNTSRYHSSKIQFNVHKLALCLQSWDCKDIFPIVDLLRLYILHPDAIKSTNIKSWNEICGLIIGKMNDIHNVDNYVQDKLLCGVILLSLRFLCNVIRTNNSIIASSLSEMLQSTMKFVDIQSSNAKNVRLAIVTLLYNIIHYLSLNKNDEAVIKTLVETCKSIIHKRYEKDAMIRLCMVIGTIGMKHKSMCVGVKDVLGDILVDEKDDVFLGVVKELHVVFA